MANVNVNLSGICLNQSFLATVCSIVLWYLTEFWKRWLARFSLENRRSLSCELVGSLPLQEQSKVILGGVVKLN